MAWIAGTSVLAVAAAFVIPVTVVGVVLLSVAITLLTIFVLLMATGMRAALEQRVLVHGLAALHERSRHLVLLTDCEGAVLWQSRDHGTALADAISPHVADAGAVLADMRDRALAEGDAVRDIGSGGRGWRLLARRTGRDLLVWELAAQERAARSAIREPSCNEYDLLPVPLLELDRSGVVRASNRAAQSLLKIAPQETPLLSAVVGGLGRSVPAWLEEAFEGRVIHRPEVGRAARASGDVYIQITLDEVPSDPDRLMALLHDATELKTLEAQFVQSQKMQAIGQLAGGVAHDFNNLLTAIGGHCDLLLMRRDPTDADFSDIEQINQNANRAASLVRQLLAFSRKQNLRPEPIDLRAVLADLAHLLSRLVGERITLTWTHDPDLLLVRADKRQIEQVIMNLVVNARDAMPDGGEVSIRTEMVQFDVPQVRDRAHMPEGIYVVVTVSDCGKGIAEEKLPKIFEPFYTTKRQGEGTGLGLSTAYGIVKQTGGYIFADSRPEEGATFSLFFPAHENVGDEVKAAPESDAEILTAVEGVVLLVEDEPPVRAFAARALRLKGFTVLEAASAEHALDILSDTQTHVDLFLSDVIMPGADGPTWVRQALENRPDTPVIFMSGYAEESFSEDQSRIAGSTFLQKPFSLNELVTTAQQALGRIRKS